MNLNKAFLIGRLTRSPEMRTLPSGQSVVNFGLATGRFFTDKSGQKQQQTEFHNIVMFGRLAEIASQYLTKGSLVFIEGRIQTRNWQDGSGNKRQRTEIVAESMQLGPRTTMGAKTTNGNFAEKPAKEETTNEEQIPIVEENEEEIDIKEIPF